MSKKLIPFEDNLEHEVAEVVCLKCLKRWVGVYPVSTPLKQLECPCGQTGYVIKTGQTIVDERIGRVGGK